MEQSRPRGEDEQNARPSLEDLDQSDNYFGRLQQALTHYSSDAPPGRLMTIGAGGATTEAVFPPLDEMPEHLQKLKFAAMQLDKVPIEMWNDFGRRISRGDRDCPYIPMQISVWGSGNEKNNTFMKCAIMANFGLGSFSWKDSENPDWYRDEAEQCSRIIFSYTQIKRYFDRTGTPPAIKDF